MKCDWLRSDRSDLSFFVSIVDCKVWWICLVFGSRPFNVRVSMEMAVFCYVMETETNRKPEDGDGRPIRWLRSVLRAISIVIRVIESWMSRFFFSCFFFLAFFFAGKRSRLWQIGRPWLFYFSATNQRLGCLDVTSRGRRSIEATIPDGVSLVAE